MSVKISELNETTTLNDSDVLPVVNGNETKKVQVTNVVNHVSSKLDIAGIQQEILLGYDQIPTATATGDNINVQDSSNLPPKDFVISGNATQDGTPTPDTPQDIHVVTGDNTITISNSDNTEAQTQLISLGNIELALIPNINVKDNIFKLNGKWWLTKRTGKRELDGVTTGYKFSSFSDTKNNRGVINIENSKTGIVYTQNYALSNYWVYNTSVYSDTANTQGFVIGNSYSFYFRFGSESSVNSLTLANEFLATNKPIIMYELETPTTTEITDTTLIAQLENILQMHTNKNVTNAWIEPSGTNAQGGLTLTYYRDLQTITDKIDSLEARISLLE